MLNVLAFYYKLHFETKATGKHLKLNDYYVRVVLFLFHFLPQRPFISVSLHNFILTSYIGELGIITINASID